jgi:hypothetical protein
MRSLRAAKSESCSNRSGRSGDLVHEGVGREAGDGRREGVWIEHVAHNGLAPQLSQPIALASGPGHASYDVALGDQQRDNANSEHPGCAGQEHPHGRSAFLPGVLSGFEPLVFDAFCSTTFSGWARSHGYISHAHTVLGRLRAGG